MIRQPRRAGVLGAAVMLTLTASALVMTRSEDSGGWRMPDVEPGSHVVAGSVHAGDVPIVDAPVTLGVDDQRFITDDASGRTASDGSFVLYVPPEYDLSDDARGGVFVEVTLEARSTSGDETSSVQIRRPARVGAVDHDLWLPEGSSCPGDECDRRLPDLEPVTEGAVLAGDQSLPQHSVRLDDTTVQGRRLLRFSTLTANIGDGPLHMVATGDGTGDTTPTVQRIWTSDLTFEDRLAGVFVYHPGHDHIHVEDFERYRLLDDAGTVVAEADKISYCLRDSVRLEGVDVLPPFGVFTGTECGREQQAVNSGYADYYGAELADQWIDVTSVASGDYRIEIAVDPSDVIVESDETNNVVTFPVTIPAAGV